MKLVVFILACFWGITLNAQTYNYSYTDPCTGVLKSIVVPVNGTVTVGYYGEIGSFNQSDFTNGTFESWANNIFSQYGQNSPCSQIVGIGTTISVTQNAALNVIGILNSLSTISDMTNGATNILGGSISSVSNSSNGRKNNKNNKNNKNENSGNNNINSSNTNNGSNSGVVSNGTSNSSSNPQVSSPETTGNKTQTENSSTSENPGGSSNSSSSVSTSNGTGENGNSSTNTTNEGGNKNNTSGSTSFNGENNLGGNTTSEGNTSINGGNSTGGETNSTNETNTGGNNTEGGNTTSGETTTINNNGGENTTVEGNTTGGNTTSEGTTSSNGNVASGTNITNGTNSSNGTNTTNENITTNGTNTTSGNSTGSGGNQTQETPQATQEETKGETNITAGATTTISAVSNSKEGGKPTVVASSDFVGFNFKNSEVKTGLKLTGGYTATRWDGKRSYGTLVDYTSALKGPNITGFYAWVKPKHITLLSGTLTVGFEGNKSLYGTIAAGQMFTFKKIKRFKLIYMGTISYGAVYRTPFTGTAVIGGAMYDIKVINRLDIKLMNLMVYAPYVSYYNDVVMKSPYVMLPSIGINVGITKKFKFNINAGGAWDLKTAALNYTVTCGTRMLIGQ